MKDYTTEDRIAFAAGIYRLKPDITKAVLHDIMGLVFSIDISGTVARKAVEHVERTARKIALSTECNDQKDKPKFACCLHILDPEQTDASIQGFLRTYYGSKLQSHLLKDARHLAKSCPITPEEAEEFVGSVYGRSSPILQKSMGL